MLMAQHVPYPKSFELQDNTRCVLNHAPAMRSLAGINRRVADIAEDGWVALLHNKTQMSLVMQHGWEEVLIYIAV